MGINAVASVYFPPLAWELIYPGETTLTDERRADVTGWTTFKPGDVQVLDALVPALPTVCHPWHDPARNEHWVELFSSEITPIIECPNVEGGPAGTLDPQEARIHQHRRFQNAADAQAGYDAARLTGSRYAAGMSARSRDEASQLSQSNWDQIGVPGISPRHPAAANP